MDRRKEARGSNKKLSNECEFVAVRILLWVDTNQWTRDIYIHKVHVIFYYNYFVTNMVNDKQIEYNLFANCGKFLGNLFIVLEDL